MAVQVYSPLYGAAVYGDSRYGSTVWKNLDTVAGTTALGTIQVNTTEVILEGVSAQGAIGTPEVQPREVILDSLVGDTQLGTLQVNIAEVPTSVEATGATATVTVNLSEVLESVSGEAQVATVGVGIRVETIVGVEATGAVSGDVTLRSFNTLTILGVGANFTVNNEGLILTGEKFDYASFREQYDRRRTVYIGRAA